MLSTHSWPKRATGGARRATARRPDEIVQAIHRLDRVALKLEVFPNETLMLQSLMGDLPALERDAGG